MTEKSQREKPQGRVSSRSGTAPPESGRWKKGQSGNPGGAPKGILTYIREQTRDGKDLINFMLIVARGKIPEGLRNAKPKKATIMVGGKRQTAEVEADFKDRQDAVKWLMDRGYGKAVQPVEASGPGGGPMQFEAEIINAGQEFAGRIARLASRVGAEAGTGQVGS